MITAEEFFRNKLYELHPNRVCISLANELITAEQGMRWAHEFKQLHLHGVMQVPQFEELLQVRLDELPYTKHLDDGQYNDGQAYGFECGARWAYEKLYSGTAVGNGAAGQSGSGGICTCSDKPTGTNKSKCTRCGGWY